MHEKEIAIGTPQASWIQNRTSYDKHFFHNSSQPASTKSPKPSHNAQMQQPSKTLPTKAGHANPHKSNLGRGKAPTAATLNPRSIGTQSSCVCSDDSMGQLGRPGTDGFQALRMQVSRCCQPQISHVQICSSGLGGPCMQGVPCWQAQPCLHITKIGSSHECTLLAKYLLYCMLCNSVASRICLVTPSGISGQAMIIICLRSGLKDFRQSDPQL